MRGETPKITRFFETKGASFLLESLYVKSYMDLHCCSIKRNNTILLFFSELNKEETSNAFFNVINDDGNYQVFTNRYLAFLEDINEKSLLYAKNGNRCELIRLFLDFLSFYRFTESFYTDYTYQICEKTGEYKEKLHILEKLKTSGRLFINSFFNGSNSYLNIASKSAPNSLLFMQSSVDEVINNSPPAKALVDVRINDHLLSYNNKLYLSNTTEYKKIQESLIWSNEKQQTTKLQGIVASPGKVRAIAYVINADFTCYDYLEQIINNMPMDTILVTETTSPDLIKACSKAVGIITNQGGLGSHAAIISRELGIPCIVSTKIATQIISSGDVVEIDDSKGEIRIVGTNNC